MTRVYGLCRRLCGDVTLAEDLCQEAFVRAWTGLASYRGKAAFGTWLHRVAVNTVLGHRRWSDSREDLRAEDLWPGIEACLMGQPSSRRPVRRVVLAVAALVVAGFALSLLWSPNSGLRLPSQRESGIVQANNWTATLDDVRLEYRHALDELLEVV